MTDKDKLEKLKKLADAMYYAAKYLTTDASRLHKAMDEYHKFVILEYHNRKEDSVNNGLDLGCGVIWKDIEPVSEDEENALNSVAITFLQEQQIVPNFYADIIMKAVKRGANWQKQQMMKDADDYLVDDDNTIKRFYDTGGVVGKPIIFGSTPDSINVGDHVKVIVIKEE